MRNSPASDKVDFDDVNNLIRCEFDKLRPPPISLMHYYKEVDTFSDVIDCTNNLLSPPTSVYDLK
ncbi:hypothetical protein PMAYCL1PPCAC_11304, partial [Pristionchus mayeri]